MKKFPALPVLLLALAIAVGAWFHLGDSPRPKEATLIQHFHERKPDYERLRDMLLAERTVRLVATWGVETADSVGSVTPPIADFSSARYQEYLTLLEQAGGHGVARSRDAHPEVCIYVWRAGFAGESRHESLCWREAAPPDQVASIDKIDDVPTPAGGGRGFFYKRVEGNWYVLRDE